MRLVPFILCWPWVLLDSQLLPSLICSHFCWEFGGNTVKIHMWYPGWELLLPSSQKLKDTQHTRTHTYSCECHHHTPWTSITWTSRRYAWMYCCASKVCGLPAADGYPQRCSEMASLGTQPIHNQGVLGCAAKHFSLQDPEPGDMGLPAFSTAWGSEHPTPLHSHTPSKPSCILSGTSQPTDKYLSPSSWHTYWKCPSPAPSPCSICAVFTWKLGILWILFALLHQIRRNLRHALCPASPDYWQSHIWIQTVMERLSHRECVLCSAHSPYLGQFAARVPVTRGLLPCVHSPKPPCSIFNLIFSVTARWGSFIAIFHKNNISIQITIMQKREKKKRPWKRMKSS